MKKKKLFTELFSLLFVAALVFMIYVLIEMRSSVLSVIGAGVVLLITAYLLIDFIMDNVLEKDNKFDLFPEADPVVSRLNELESVQKALYTATKRNGSDAQNVSQALLTTLASIDNKLGLLNQELDVDSAVEINQRRILQVAQNTHDALQFIRQDQQNGVKMVIKYNKENARQLAEIFNENTDKLINKLNEQLDKAGLQLDQLEAQVATTRELSSNAEPAVLPSGPDEITLAKLDELLTELKAIEEKLSSGLTVAALPEEPKKPSRSRKPKKTEEPAPEPENPILEALLSEPVAEPVAEPVVEAVPEPVVEAVAEPIIEAVPEPVVEAVAEPVVEAVPEPVVEPEPAPEPAADPFAGLVSDDPNKKMSADDIAALFAAANAAPAPEPEPVVEPEPAPEPAADPFAGLVSDDPNKKMSADDIAALFAAMGNQ